MIKIKDSGVKWIGEIPEDWSVGRLKYLSNYIKSGGTPDSNKNEYYSEDGLAWVTISDMTTSSHVTSTIK